MVSRMSLLVSALALSMAMAMLSVILLSNAVSSGSMLHCSLPSESVTGVPVFVFVGSVVTMCIVIELLKD